MADLHAVADARCSGSTTASLARASSEERSVSVAAVARNAASAAVRILDGAPPSSISTPAEGPGTPTYDQRELTRWGSETPASRRAAPSSSVSRPAGSMPTNGRSPRSPYCAWSKRDSVLALLASRRRLNEAKEKLRASEERMSLAATAANLGLWVWDIARDEMWVAESGRAVFGLLEIGAGQLRAVRQGGPSRRPGNDRPGDQLALAGKEDLEIEYRLSGGTARAGSPPAGASSSTPPARRH